MFGVFPNGGGGSSNAADGSGHSAGSRGSPYGGAGFERSSSGSTTVIANSVSNGRHGVATSHAIAYGSPRSSPPSPPSSSPSSWKWRHKSLDTVWPWHAAGSRRYRSNATFPLPNTVHGTPNAVWFSINRFLQEHRLCFLFSFSCLRQRVPVSSDVPGLVIL